MANSPNLGNLDSAPASATFGQDASFHLEQPIGSMSISPSGRDIVLASKEGLHIVDLDSPYSPPRYLPHRTPWEVADVQWSPFAVRDYWIVSTSNQKALVWNVGSYSDRDAIEFVLHGHSRAITDINFSAHHPEILATCAVDSFVHGWDLRIPSRPAFSFSDWFAGASQVKFSRQDEHVIASAHDRSLHVWDKRKGAYPMRTIEAHETKICGIDWNRFESSKIVTCSLDKTIKFWNVNNSSNDPDRVIETGFPVWRARHTPFGWGLLAMPQRGTSELYLYDRRPIDGTLSTGQVRAVKAFSGHKGFVKEFLWRSTGPVGEVDSRDFQLVSWGTDRELRLHHVPEDVFHDVGFERGVTRTQRMNVTRKGARYRTFRDGPIEPYSPSEPSFRTDSFPSQGHFLGLRNRHSTGIGMNKVPVAQFRGWLQGNRRERRTGMHGKGTLRQDINPIAWMKNVKIASWDPDSLAEEITQVGDRIQGVEFDSIDISQRKAVMSLQGPWGEKNSLVYTRVEFKFPKNYPRGANAIVMLQKSTSISPETHRMLSTEVHTITETYASRQRGCIEAVVRYLLHKQNMEEIVAWLLGETIGDSKIIDPSELPDDLSSDSDDGDLTGTVDPSNSAANIRVPIAKGCGAIWANDGRLVCFFPKTPKEPESVLSVHEISGFEDVQSKRLFDAFGRLQADSPARRQTYGNSSNLHDMESDVSDASSTFSSNSSSSSSSSEAEDVLRDKFRPYRNGAPLGLVHQRSRSDDRSNKSTTVDGTRLDAETHMNVISIHHDMSDLIPAKKAVAERYRIMGDGRSVCEHNAAVADEANSVEAASVWRLAALILDRRVPLVPLEPIHSGAKDILIIAREMATESHYKGGGLGSYDSSIRLTPEHKLNGYVRWGNSPLASTYLITAMFNYFERKADIQMLATLSCVFMQSEHPVLSKNIRHDAFVDDRDHLAGQSYFPSAIVACASFNREGKQTTNQQAFSSMDHESEVHENRLTIPTHFNPRYRRQTFHSDSRSHSQYVDQSARGSAPSAVDSRVTGRPDVLAKATSASSSPEGLRADHRTSNSPTFAISRASLSAVAQSYSRSPPSENSTAASSLKRASPSTSMTTSTWAGALFGRDAGSRASAKSLNQAVDSARYDDQLTNTRSSVASISRKEITRDSRKTTNTSRKDFQSSTIAEGEKLKKKSRQRRQLRTTLHNQDQFDLDGYADQSLLDSHYLSRHTAYLAAYAELLAVWNLWSHRAEILQFDAVFENTKRGKPNGSHYLASIATEAGLDVRRCCTKCDSPLVPLIQNDRVNRWHCVSNKCLLSVARQSTGQTCSICQKVLRGLAVPCLQCEHVTCYECAQDWFGVSKTYDDQRSVVATASVQEQRAQFFEETVKQQSPPPPPCPTGCGCFCTVQAEIHVPWPANAAGSNFNSNGLYKTQTAPSASTSTTTTTIPSVVIRQPTSNTTSSSTPSGRHKIADPGLDTALGVMMALSSRSRAPSTATVATSTTSTKSHDDGNTNNNNNNNNSSTIMGTTTSTTTTTMSDIDEELMPWASGRFTSLGRGIGGGLSRGLSNRSSDATIRKA